MAIHDHYIYDIFKPEVINAYQTTKDLVNEALINGEISLEDLQASVDELSKLEASNIVIALDRYLHLVMTQILQEVLDESGR